MAWRSRHRLRDSPLAAAARRAVLMARTRLLLAGEIRPVAAGCWSRTSWSAAMLCSRPDFPRDPARLGAWRQLAKGNDVTVINVTLICSAFSRAPRLSGDSALRIACSAHRGKPLIRAAPPKPRCDQRHVDDGHVVALGELPAKHQAEQGSPRKVPASSKAFAADQLVRDQHLRQQAVFAGEKRSSARPSGTARRAAAASGESRSRCRRAP